MEEKLNNDFVYAIRQGLHLKEMNAMLYSPLTLAYIGDDVYDLIIRTYLIHQGNMPVNKINRRANSIVKAETQSKIASFIERFLTEEEKNIYRRGRNAKSATMAKNATVIDYKKATGLEALIGYLYLTEKYERLVELIRIGLEHIGEISL